MLNVSVESREVGTVIQVGDGWQRVDGLREPWPARLPRSSSERAARPCTVWPRTSKRTRSAPCSGDVTAIKENDQVRTTGRIVEVPAGKAMLGRVVNLLGQPIDGKGPYLRRGHAPGGVQGSRRYLRQPVNELGCRPRFRAIDSMKLTGRGQREFIIIAPLDRVRLPSRSMPSSTKRSGRVWHLRRHRPEGLNGGRVVETFELPWRHEEHSSSWYRHRP